MTVNSDKSINYFPNNKPYCFFTHLQSSLKLQENWRVSLIDIKIPIHDVFNEKDVYLHCNICTKHMVDGIFQPLQRRICLISTDTGYYTFDNLLYISTIKSEVFDIEFYLTDENGDLGTFLTQPVSLTLHFKAYPFFY